MRHAWLCTALLLFAGCGRIAVDGLAEDAGPCVPVGHDEDADGVDDACDVCPHLSGSQVDQDGDRVGDACDSEPTLPRQHLVLFEPFVDVAAWSAINGAHVSNDQLVLDARDDFRILRRPYVRGHDLFIVKGSAGTTGNGSSLFAIMTTNPAGGRFYCELFDNGVNSQLQFTYTFDGTSYATLGRRTTLERVVNGGGQLGFELGPSDATCTSSWHDEALTSNTPVPAFVIDTLQLYAENIDVSFDYFVQIRSDD